MTVDRQDCRYRGTLIALLELNGMREASSDSIMPDSGLKALISEGLGCRQVVEETFGQAIEPIST